MWQLYALAGLFASAGQDVVDKFAIIKGHAIDSVVATFHRLLLFVIVTGLIGWLGWLGPIHLFFSWAIILFAPFSIVGSLLLTYLLRKVEVTSIGAIYYLAPLLFLFIDAHWLAMRFTAWQVAGVALLVLGGIGFSLDGKTHRPKPELTRWVWIAFVFNILYGGIEAYYFKHVHNVYGVNGVSFFASIWLLAGAGLLLVVLAQGKARRLFDRTSRAYVPRVALSKSFDAINSVLWAQALSLAAVSQVSAFDAFFPLVLFLTTVVVQGIFKVRLRERLGRDNLLWKTVSVCLLVAGGLLVT